MVIAYPQRIPIDKFLIELEALNDWKDNLYRAVFFHSVGGNDAAKVTAPPDGVLVWCRQQSGTAEIDKNIIVKVEESLRSMHLAAQDMSDLLKGPLSEENFDKFTKLFDQHFVLLRQIYEDLSSGAEVFDPITGLRSVEGMRLDLRREQDRMERKETPYCLAALEIDNLDQVMAGKDRRAVNALFAEVARVLASSLRSFDDAYFLGGGEYLAVLKHVNLLDACAVMDRIRIAIRNNSQVLPNGEKVRVTISCGVAEAMQKEGYEQTMATAKSALLDVRAHGGDAVREYREKSALEKMVEQQNH